MATIAELRPEPVTTELAAEPAALETGSEDPEQNARSRMTYWQQAQAEARSYPIFPKFWGLTKSAAALNADVCKLQYDLFCEALEKISLFGNSLDKIYALVFGIVGVVVGVVGFIQNQDTISATGDWGPQHIVLSAGFCVLIGYCMGQARKRLNWYNKPYGTALGLEHADPVEPWRVTGIAQTRLPRLTFVAEPDDYYFGSTGNAGVEKGIMLFSAQEKTLREMTLDDIRNAPVGKGSVTGRTGRATRALLDSSEEAAEFKRQMGKSLAKTLAEQSMWLFFAIVMLFVFLEIGSAGGVSDSAGISNAAAGALEQVGG
ncbi:MAG: hypothetical protein F4Z14_06590 [Gammaproteobacteria bacterium]|nr:hypothetical protein [Gammaproteobacteria bacterium]